MNARCCCQVDSSDPNGQTHPNDVADGKLSPPGIARRCLGIAQWIVPSTVLALMPKCPACVAAYLALATGIGISLPAATFIRTTLGVLCIASLVFLLARSMRRALLRASTTLARSPTR
jgi:hypothetical protein